MEGVVVVIGSFVTSSSLRLARVPAGLRYDIAKAVKRLCKRSRHSFDCADIIF